MGLPKQDILRFVIIFEIAMVTITLMSNSASGRMVDMTHILNKDAMHYYMFRDFELKPAVKGFQAHLHGMWVEANDLMMSEHTGTHVDAPVHTYKSGIYIHQIPITDLIGPAIVINITEQALTDPDYALTVKDIEDFEKLHGRIADRSIVLIDTSGAKHYDNRPVYTGSQDVTNGSTWHFPGFGAESVTWLMDNRNIAGIGSDRLSFDIGQTNNNFPVHRVLAASGRFGLENVNNVNKLPPVGATIFVTPLPMEKGSGSPARIVALWDTDLPGLGSSATAKASFLMMLASLFVVVINVNE